MRAGEAARREAAEAEEAAARSAARRDAALDANVLLHDELHGSVSPEREDALRARVVPRARRGGRGGFGGGFRDDSRDSRRAPSPFLCVIERGCAEIRVALNRDDFDDESDVGGDDGRTDSDVDRGADTRRARARDGTRARLGFGPSRLVARSRGGTRLPSTAPRWRRCSAARRARRSRSSCATPKTPGVRRRRVRPVGTARPRARSRRWRLRCCVAARRSRRSGPTSPRWAPSRTPRARSSWTRRGAQTGARARTSASRRAPCGARSASSRDFRAIAHRVRGGGRNGGGRGALDAEVRRGARARRATRLRRMPTRRLNRVASRARRADPFRGA